VLMVFSVLVIPAVIAFFFTRSFSRALLIAWGSGTLAIVLGLGVSFTLDIATGPMLVVSFGIVLAIAMLFRGRFGVRVRDPADRGLRLGMFGDGVSTKAAE